MSNILKNHAEEYSEGDHYGARKSRITAGDLALMGKGPIARVQPVKAPPWKGTERIKEHFDKVQSELNHELGYW